MRHPEIKNNQIGGNLGSASMGQGLAQRSGSLPAFGRAVESSGNSSGVYGGQRTRLTLGSSGSVGVEFIPKQFRQSLQDLVCPTKTANQILEDPDFQDFGRWVSRQNREEALEAIQKQFNSLGFVNDADAASAVVENFLTIEKDESEKLSAEQKQALQCILQALAGVLAQKSFFRNLSAHYPAIKNYANPGARQQGVLASSVDAEKAEFIPRDCRNILDKFVHPLRAGSVIDINDLEKFGQWASRFEHGEALKFISAEIETKPFLLRVDSSDLALERLLRVFEKNQSRELSSNQKLALDLVCKALIQFVSAHDFFAVSRKSEKSELEPQLEVLRSVGRYLDNTSDVLGADGRLKLARVIENLVKPSEVPEKTISSKQQADHLPEEFHDLCKALFDHSEGNDLTANLRHSRLSDFVLWAKEHNDEKAVLEVLRQVFIDINKPPYDIFKPVWPALVALEKKVWLSGIDEDSFSNDQQDALDLLKKVIILEEETRDFRIRNVEFDPEDQQKFNLEGFENRIRVLGACQRYINQNEQMKNLLSIEKRKTLNTEIEDVSKRFIMNLRSGRI